MLFTLVLLFKHVMSQCPDLTWGSYRKLSEELTEIPVNSLVECVAAAFAHHDYAFASKIAELAIGHGLTFPSEMIIEIQGVKKEVEGLLSALEVQGTSKNISPALQWAQSPDKVYIDVKFSHRLDSPGCLEITEPSTDIQETQLSFLGKCSKSGEKITIELALELFDTILPEESSSSFNSIGRVQFVLKKKGESAWDKLVKGKSQKNHHTWWEMKKEFDSEMEKFEDSEPTGPRSGLEELMDNPNVIIENSYVDGKRLDNTKRDL